MTMPRCLTGTFACLLAFSVVLLGAWQAANSMSAPSGDIDYWFAMEQCTDPSKTFTVPSGTGSTMWRVSRPWRCA